MICYMARAVRFFTEAIGGKGLMAAAHLGAPNWLLGGPVKGETLLW